MSRLIEGKTQWRSRGNVPFLEYLVPGPFCAGCLLSEYRRVMAVYSTTHDVLPQPKSTATGLEEHRTKYPQTSGHGRPFLCVAFWRCFVPVMGEVTREALPTVRKCFPIRDFAASYYMCKDTDKRVGISPSRRHIQRLTSKWGLCGLCLPCV